MSDNIPREVLIDIYLRLTLEDLGRCISVCKSWYSLITTPLFISLHAKQLAATTTTSDLLLVRDCNDDFISHESIDKRYLIHSHKNSGFRLYKIFDFRLKSCDYDMHYRVIGCSNGLICLSGKQYTIPHVLVLWNPTIRKSLTLPSPLVTVNSHGPFKHCIGFGFNAANNDFKVVRVVYLVDGLWLHLGPPMVEVYELSVGSWRSVDPKGFSYFIDQYCSQVFLNGAVHWTLSDRNDSIAEPFNTIVSFDLRTDAFGVMKVSADVVPDHYFPFGSCVSTCGESLALIQTIFSGGRKTCWVWVMKQYGVADSWTKLFNIDLTGGILKVCGVLNSEAALVIVDKPQHYTHPYSPLRNETLISYDPKRNDRNYIGEILEKESIFVDHFVETLALLGVKGGESV